MASSPPEVVSGTTKPKPPQSQSQSQSQSSRAPPSEDTLRLIEAVLDHIRSNLANIRNVWGVDSVQYKSASEIMNSYLDDNLRAHSVNKDDIAALLENMSISQ